MAVEVIRKEPLTKKEQFQLWNHYMHQCNNNSNNVNWFGYIWPYTLYPFFKKFYNEEGIIQRMKVHKDMYNSESITSSITYGIVLSMEEEKALHGTITDDIIRTTKASLMGPMAGIGDSIVQGTVIPLLLSIAVSLTQGGNVIGPIFYAAAVLAFMFFYGRFLFNQGYSLGRSAASMLASGNIQKITDAVSLFGVTILGTLASSYLKPKTILSFPNSSTGEPTYIQTLIDNIFPNLLGLLLVIGCYVLIRKKNFSMSKMTLIMLVGVIALACLGII